MIREIMGIAVFRRIMPLRDVKYRRNADMTNFCRRVCISTGAFSRHDNVTVETITHGKQYCAQALGGAEVVRCREQDRSVRRAGALQFTPE